MDNKLYKNKNLEVRKSEIHGYGVFATKDIKANEILEECHFVKTYHRGCKFLNRYKFNWPRLKGLTGEEKLMNIEHGSIVLGWGSIYNSALTEEKSNADWECDENRKLYLFKTIKDIKKESEILIFYGEDYIRSRGKDFKDCNCEENI